MSTIDTTITPTPMFPWKGNLKNNKLADLIWAIYENSKQDTNTTQHTVQFGEIPPSSSPNSKEEQRFILSYIDDVALFNQPFLTTENATIQVVVTSSDFHHFIESLNAKNIAIELVPLKNLLTEIKPVAQPKHNTLIVDNPLADLLENTEEAVPEPTYNETKEFLSILYCFVGGLLIVVSAGLLGAFVSPWCSFAIALAALAGGLYYVTNHMKV